jgi:saccharopine dehydrogenase-like NADP-dependent oxidoreductase
MKVLVVGCGKIGAEIARDLAGSKEVFSVVVADANPTNLAVLAGTPKVRTEKVDIARKATLRPLIRDADIVCGALPGRIGFELLREAVGIGKNIVDISYTSEDPLQLHKKALANGCTLVPQCGVAPGFTNMCVGDASRRLDRMTRVQIFVGGLPQSPVPPFNYRIVFSLDDVINEYTRDVKIIEKGAAKMVRPLSGRGVLAFPGVGELEYFLTDGLGTLPKSFPHVQEMYELTLRYPGHAQIIEAMRLAGFFDSRKIRVNGTLVEPRRISMELLKSVFSLGSQDDLLALRVEVEGIQAGRRILLIYQMLDLFDKRHGTSAMARTTAYPCTSVAILVGSGMVKTRGVVPPEKIGQDQKLFRFVLSRLKQRRVRMRIHTGPMRS